MPRGCGCSGSEITCAQVRACVSEESAELLNPEAMVPWYAAIAERDSEQARVLALGDSITIGAFLTDIRLSWTFKLQTRLRTMHGLAAGADGYVSVTGDFFVPSASVNASPPGVAQLEKWGLGERLALLTDIASFAEWSARPYNAVRIWHGHWNNFFAGDLDVLINGVATPPDLTSVGADASGFFTDYTGLPGNQTVRVRPEADDVGGPIEGVEFFSGDIDSGFHVYNHAQSGWQSTNYLDANAEVAWGVPVVLQPQLVIVYLGTNDVLLNETSTALANLDLLLAKIEEKVTDPHSVLLIGGYRTTNQDNTKWAAWQTGLRARATGNRAYLNLAAVWPVLTPDGSNNMGLMVETSDPIVHPNLAGHQLIADTIANHIVP